MYKRQELGSGLDAFTDWTLINATFILLVMKNHLSAFWVILLVIPSIISGTAKMAYTKKQKIVPVTIVARLGVGLTYITIISILVTLVYSINIGYNIYFADSNCDNGIPVNDFVRLQSFKDAKIKIKTGIKEIFLS